MPEDLSDPPIQATADTLEVPLAEIKVPPVRARELGDLCDLVESIRTLGLLAPIVVTPDGTLVAGRHRLEACRILGHPSIPVRIVDLDPVQAEIAELDENLLHAPLSTVERMQHLARRKVLFELLHPETRHGGAPGLAGGGKKARDPGPGGFVAQMSERTGRGKSTVAEEIRIGEKLAPDVVGALKGLDAGNSKAELAALAALPVEQQRETVERLQSGEIASVRSSVQPVSAENEASRPDIFSDVPELNAVVRGLADAEQALEALRCGWSDAPGPDVDRLLERLPRILSQVGVLRVLIQDEWIPQQACATCEGAGTDCSTCRGLGWLSQAALRANGEKP